MNAQLLSFRSLLVGAIAVLLVSCAASSVKKTWKAADYNGGPVTKVAVLTVEERGLIRQGLENRFRNQLEAGGQPALVSHALLSLGEIKENREAAAARVREAGADSVLIMRLVDSATHTREVRATSGVFVPVTTGIGTGYTPYGWHDYYTIAFMDMGTVWGSVEQKVYLETTLFALKSGQPIWSAMTETVLREDMDRLEEADQLVAKILAAARKDGFVR